ncbi:MAG TPA: PLP-dependent aminotransferase family protein [Terriglobales bacterium]|nr:PLP-dependent aminotransferase family protein [Terriglobales bacterium]
MKRNSLSVSAAGLVLDEASSQSLYSQLYQQLRTKILKGHLQPGARLPSTRALASELAIARNTVMNAYEQLLAEGYLEGETGSGTYVARALPEAVLHTAPVESARRAGRSVARLSRRGEALACNRVIGRYADPPKPFRPGIPALDHFPFAVWNRLLAKYWRREPAGLLPYTDPAGYGPLRVAIADYIRSVRAVNCDAEQIIIVSGAQQALDLASRLLLDSGDEVWMEDPGYNGARAAFLSAGVKPVPIPIDDAGLDVSAGERLSPKARLAYVTPSHQYPTGVVMTLARRLELLDWAERRRSWILEDDYDSEYRYASRPVASLQGLDKGGTVTYCGTFSKVLFPALRLGYMVLPAPLVDAFRRAKAVIDRHCPTVEQAVVAEFIAEGHLARHIRRMRMLYLERQNALLESLRRELAGALEVHAHEAGMHVLALLAKGKRDGVISHRAQRLGVEAPALSGYRARPGGRGGLVLGYAGYSAQQIRAAVRKLALAMEPL